MKLKKFSQAVAFMVAMLLVLAVPATAAEISAVPFIKAQYYKGQGSNALTLEQFRGNPRIYYRNEQAFQMGRKWAERVIDTSLTDAEYKELLQSDRVRVVSCSSEVTTGGLLPENYHWFQRQCYSKEEIVQVKVGDEWKDLLSLSCLNPIEPIEDKTPPLIVSPTPETEPVEKVAEASPTRKCWVDPEIQLGNEVRISTSAYATVSCGRAWIQAGVTVIVPAGENVVSENATCN